MTSSASQFYSLRRVQPEHRVYRMLGSIYRDAATTYVGRIPIGSRGGFKKSLCSLPRSFHCSVIHKCQNTTGNSGVLLKRPCPILQIKFVDMSQGVSHDGGRGEGVVCPYCMYWSW